MILNFQGLKFVVPPSHHFPARVNFSYMHNAPQFIKKYLSSNQLEMFRRTCFGFLLDMDEIVGQAQVIHSLLLREVECADADLICFLVGGKELRFGLVEFSMLSGLKCVGNLDTSVLYEWDGQLMSKYFGDDKVVPKSSLHDAIKYRRWDSDVDAVKLAVLFIIHRYVNTCRLDRGLTKEDFAMVDSGLFENYPWGLASFNSTLQSLKGRLSDRGALLDSSTTFNYRVDGFPVVFQCWFYEVCLRVDGAVAYRIGTRSPKILNWKTTSQPTLISLRKMIFDFSEVIICYLYVSVFDFFLSRSFFKKVGFCFFFFFFFMCRLLFRTLCLMMRILILSI